MRKFTLAALTAFFAVSLSAQNKCTVSGYIRDAATGETLIGAGVMVMVTDAASGGKTSGISSGTKASATTSGAKASGAMSASSASGTKSEEKALATIPGTNASAEAKAKSSMANSKIIGAVTNEFGYYTITIPCGNIDLTYSYVGCADVKQNIDLQRDTVINISLLQAASLKASTIVGRKDAGIQSTYMGAMEIPQEMIKNMPVVLGEPDVIKTIQLMPGVQGGMEGFSGIYVRGGGADENLMMLDGTPLYNVSHLLGLLSVFTPEAVKKVTFYKGSFPARYGGRVSSIVDVRTNDGNAKGFHGSVSAGLLSEKLHFEGPIASENTTWSFSARGMHTFLFDRLIKAFGSPANYAFYDINAKVTHRFSDSDKLFAGFYTGRDYFRYSDSDKSSSRYYGPDYEPYTKYEEENTKMNLKWGNTLASVRWNHVFNSKLFANTSVSWNTYKMNMVTNTRELLKSETENYDKQYRYFPTRQASVTWVQG